MSKETQRTPPRGPTGDRMYSSAHLDQGRIEDRYPGNLERGRGYERSKSPRREGRGRYTDRDREDYQSPPRDRSRSRSPYYGAPPNRNVILEGLPMEMTQEDVGRPVPTSLRTSHTNPILS
jgi:RNA-binding protein 5/10